ncbi:MAG: hypothetical protein WAO07_05145 [Desulfobacterales bacterium]
MRLDLETDGFTYQKGGSEQRCKRGDWLVDNDGDIYSVDGAVFEKTYRKTGPNVYIKTATVWAEVAASPGRIVTKEGESSYRAGDYLVHNDEDGTDDYCISAGKFESMYEVYE